MKVLSLSCFQAYWQPYPPDVLERSTGTTVGGGEEAFLRTAVGLKALGHTVETHHYGKSGYWRGVQFHGPQEDFYKDLVRSWDAVVAWSSIQPFAWTGKTKHRLLAQQLNDLNLVGDFSKLDCVISPSFTHADMVRNAWGWKGARAVVYNGIVPEVYGLGTENDGREVCTPLEARPLWVGYWSSPDRGLHHLLRAWPLVTKQIPEAKLHVFYEIERLLALNKIAGIGHFGARNFLLGELVQKAQADSSIVFHGAVPRLELAKTQAQCRVQAYPYDPFQFCEGFATAVCQGLAAGCTVLCTPKDALPELYGDDIHWFERDPVSKDFLEEVAQKVVDGLLLRLSGQHQKVKDGRQRAKGYAWGNASKQMAAACRGDNWF